jgi:hypothetical protein
LVHAAPGVAGGEGREALIRKLTREDVPDYSLMLWTSDNHFPIHHPRGNKLMVEAAEDVGVTHVVAGGDILDLHCLSSHDKDAERAIEHATLLQEIAPAKWFFDWMATRKAYWILGNHESRLTRFIDREALALHGTPAAEIGRLIGTPSSIEIIPNGGELRLGNLAMVHGDAEFKRGSGGAHPAAKLLQMFPDQSTICGHLHRLLSARRTSRDEDGIQRTRAAFVMPHMSLEEKHYDYVSKAPNWQIGFGLIRVWWEGNRPRFNVHQVEIMFDRKNRPYFELFGRVYK